MGRESVIRLIEEEMGEWGDGWDKVEFITVSSPDGAVVLSAEQAKDRFGFDNSGWDEGELDFYIWTKSRVYFQGRLYDEDGFSVESVPRNPDPNEEPIRH